MTTSSTFSTSNATPVPSNSDILSIPTSGSDPPSSTITPPHSIVTPPAITSSPTTSTTTRAPPTAPATIANYGYLGCYTNLISSIPLLSTPYNLTTVTLTSCISACSTANYTLSGVLQGRQCWCGRSLSVSVPPNGMIAESNCNTPCVGDGSEMCGGLNEGGFWSYATLYSANINDCFFNKTNGMGTACTPKAYAGSVMTSSSTSSYVTTAYSMPPSVPYSAPLTTNTNTAYIPAMGGPDSSKVSSASSSDYVTVDPNGATCRVPNIVYVTEQATITVSNMAAMGAASTLPESL
jgi:hypothetical protein